METESRAWRGLDARRCRSLARHVALTAALALLGAPPSNALAVPGGMHYELVSPVDVGGTATYPLSASLDGARIQLGSAANQGYGSTPSFNATTNFFVASRSSSGWVTTPMNGPAAPDNPYVFPFDLTTDLRSSLTGSANTEQFHASQLQLQRVGIDGSVQPTLPVVTDLTGLMQDRRQYTVDQIGGGADDLADFAFGTVMGVRLLAADGPANSSISSGGRLYEVANMGTPSATLRRVDIDDSNVEIGAACGAGFGAGPTGSQTNTVSNDGTKIFFEAHPGANLTCNTPRKVFARVAGAHTVELSASECQRVGCSSSVGDAEFQGASDDGNRVAFLSSDQLSDSDTDGTADLYRYDFARPSSPHLEQLSIGDATGGRSPGAGAAVEGLVRMSEDGSRVYFLAKGVLTTDANPEGRSAVSGSNNLYLYEPALNKTSFIATLDSATVSVAGNSHAQPVALSGSAGRFLVFSASAPLVAADTDGVSDVYLYDAEADQLVKVSPGNTADGADIPDQTISGRAAPPSGRAISENGEVVFATNAALAPDDSNGKRDIYLWKNGSIALVSDGQDVDGVGEQYSITPGGDQVAFATSRRLVAEDVDDVQSVYVAREGLDIIRIPNVEPKCSGDECQGPRSALPTVPVAGAPAGDGLGNLPSVEPSYRATTLSKSARTTLAKTGAVKLQIAVSEAGQVLAEARGLVGRRTVTVGAGKSRAVNAGLVSLTFKLNRAARGQLASAGRLTIKLTVSFSKVAPTQTQTVKLTRAKGKTKAGAKKQSAKRVSSKSVKRDSGR
jgi:hypothetical protein